MEYHWMLASLVECADKVANTASVYGAYLKKIKKAQKRNYF
jgi:adenine-specific DNA-methyltransferase